MSIYFHISTLVTKCLFTIDSICVKSQDVSPVCKTVVHNFNSTVSSISRSKWGVNILGFIVKNQVFCQYEMRYKYTEGTK